MKEKTARQIANEQQSNPTKWETTNQFIESQQELARSKYVCYSPDVGHYRNGGGKLTR